MVGILGPGEFANTHLIFSELLHQDLFVLPVTVRLPIPLGQIEFVLQDLLEIDVRVRVGIMLIATGCQLRKTLFENLLLLGRQLVEITLEQCLDYRV